MILTVFESLVISLVISSSPFSSGSKPFSFNVFTTYSDKSQKSAETNAFLEPVRIISFDVRSPKTALIESIIMDLPAPVSPVRQLYPATKSILVSSITAMFSICNDFSISYPIIYFEFLRLILQSHPLKQ